MPSIPDITGQMRHLRHRTATPPPQAKPSPSSSPKEQRLATDYLAIVVYPLLVLALLAEGLLIIWLAFGQSL